MRQSAGGASKLLVIGPPKVTITKLPRTQSRAEKKNHNKYVFKNEISIQV